VITLDDDIDISRGDMMVRPTNRPVVGQDLDATICWMDDGAALETGATYLLKHTTRAVKAVVKAVNYRLDIVTLHRDQTAESLRLNEIGRVTLRTTEPLLYDEYQMNRATGSFILIDPHSYSTVGAGMLRRPQS